MLIRVSVWQDKIYLPIMSVLLCHNMCACVCSLTVFGSVLKPSWNKNPVVCFQRNFILFPNKIIFFAMLSTQVFHYRAQDTEVSWVLTPLISGFIFLTLSVFSHCSQATIKCLHRNWTASNKMYLIPDVQAKLALNAVLLNDIYFAIYIFK